MILLTSTSDLLRVVTSAAVTVDVHASFMDYNGTLVTPGRTNTAISTATTTTVVASPGASVQRNVKTLTIRNKSGSSCDITVLHTDGATIVELSKMTLTAGEQLMYIEGVGFFVFDANGSQQVSGPLEVGRLLRAPQVLISGTSYVAPTGSARILVEAWGAGGGGGGASFAASNMAFGGGGAAGAYARKAFDVVAGTSYTYAIGVGGTAGANTGGTGGTGGDSTFAVSGVTVTAKGGLGGVGMVTGATLIFAPGGLGVVATLGDFNGRGDCGNPGIRHSGLLGWSGGGGTAAHWGGNGNGQNVNGAGLAGLANTGGGAGGGAAVSAAVVGGVGGSGIIVVTEFTS